MAFTVSVGEADFAALRNENAYYVDKTEIMYELVHDTNNKVTLFTRPRRFGKTLMMSMMKNFLENLVSYLMVKILLMIWKKNDIQL